MTHSPRGQHSDYIPGLRLAVMVGLSSVLLATATIWLLGTRLTEVMLTAVSARAADQLQLGVLGRVSAADFRPPYTTSKLADLGARLDPELAGLRQNGSGVMRVNVVAVDGTVIYSDNPDVRGKVVRPAEKPELATALAGSIGSLGRSTLSTDENADLRASREEAFEVYVPVVLAGDVVGAYEIYQDQAALTAVLKGTWLLLAAAFAILLCVPVLWAAVKARPASPSVGPLPALSIAPEASVGQSVRLTPRELEVLRLMSSTLSYREIAAELVISQETVRTHTKRVLRKLGQPNRTHAVLLAIAVGLLQLPEQPDEWPSKMARGEPTTKSSA